MLERLERENLFVVALDDERGWYRYHHLFADFLRGRRATTPSMLWASCTFGLRLVRGKRAGRRGDKACALGLRG